MFNELYEHPLGETNFLDTRDPMDRRLKLLEDTTLLFSGARTIEEFAAAFDFYAGKLPGVKCTGLYVLDPADGRLKLIHAKGFSEEEKTEAEETAMERHPGWVIRNKKELFVQDGVDELSSVVVESKRSFQIRSRLYFPLLHQDECFGCVGYVSEKPNFFNESFKIEASFLTRIMSLVLHRIILAKQQEASAENLRKYSTTLEALLLNLNAGVLVENEERRIVAVNKMFCDLFSIPDEPAQLTGIDCSTTAEDIKNLFVDPEGFVSRIEELLRLQEVSKNDELALVDGRFLERDYIPLFIEGAYKGHLWSYRDITSRKLSAESLERSRRLFQTVIETVADGIILIDSHNRIMIINEEVRKLWGYSKDALIREDFQVLFKERMFDPALWENDLEAMYSELIGQTVEQTGIRKDGSRFPVELNISKMEFSNEVYYSVAVSDITERKNRLADLEKAREAAEQSTKAKEQFLAHISHEIRTPMNAVLGFTHLLLELNPTVEQVKFLNAIKYSTDNLLVIINDILDFSKIEADKLEFVIDDFSVIESVNHVIESVKYSAQEKGIRINTEFAENVPFWVKGDQVRFGQILLNLVSNAVKFTEEGKVDVNISVSGDDGDRIRLRVDVSDTGIGIPDDHFEKIFASFEQVKSKKARLKKGTGLGLAIVKSLVERQGGKIRVTSTEGKGSIFTVEIPFRYSDRDDLILGSDIIDESGYTYKDLHGLNILIVEDNEMNQLVATNILKLWGCTYKIANNGKHALEIFEGENFDLVLMDLSMPVMDGFETSLHIRRDFEFPKRDVPVLAFTASAMIESRDRIYECGMNDYISKPVKPQELYKKILKLAGKVSPEGEREGNSTATHTAVKGEPGHFKYIRLDYLDELTGGDSELVDEMLRLFYDNTPPVLEKLALLYEEKNWDEMKKVAHKFKPTLSYVGIHELDGVVPQLEKHAQDFDPDGKIPGLIDTLQYYCKEALDELRRHFGE